MKFLLTFLFLLLIGYAANSQTFLYSYTDPCTGLAKSLTVPSNGVTVTYFGQIQTFSPNDFQNGVFDQWATGVLNSYGNANPCGSILGVSTSVDIAQGSAIGFISIINNISAVSEMQSALGGGSLNTMSVIESAKSATGKKDKKDKNKNSSTEGSNQTTITTNTTTVNGGQNTQNGSQSGQNSGTSQNNSSQSGSGQGGSNQGGTGSSSTSNTSATNSNQNSNQNSENNTASSGSGEGGNGNPGENNVSNPDNNQSSTQSETTQSTSGTSNQNSVNQNSQESGQLSTGNQSEGGPVNTQGQTNQTLTQSTQNENNQNGGSENSQSSGQNSSQSQNSTSSNESNSQSGQQSGETNTNSQTGNQNTNSENGQQSLNTSQNSEQNNSQNTETNSTEQVSSGGESNNNNISTENNSNSASNGSGGSGSNTPDQTENSTQTTEEKKTNVLGGTVNSSQRSTESNKPQIVLSSDFAGFNFRDKEVSFGGKGTAGWTALNWDGRKSYGVLLDYTSVIKGPNVTGFYANIAKRRIDLVSATGTISFYGRGSQYGTLAVGQMWSFPKVKNLKAIYLATGSFGNVYGEKFLGTAMIAGGMYDWKVSKRIDVKMMNLFIYAPYVSYYNDILLKSPYVIMPIIGTNIGITKKFKFNVNFGGAYAIKQNVMNFTVMFGTRFAI